MSRKLWTKEEDLLLQQEISQAPPPEIQWERVSAALRDAGHKKSAKQCRERWMNYLDPSLLRNEWRPEDNLRLIQLHELSGSHWKDIARKFPGRTDNSIKNQFFSLVRKSLRKARKAVSKNANTAEVNAIKPKILSNILSQKIEVPKEMLCEEALAPEELKFLARSPVMLKEFVMCFAFEKSPEILMSTNALLTQTVDFILQSLEQQNAEYVSKKTKSRPTKDKHKKAQKQKLLSSCPKSRKSTDQKQAENNNNFQDLAKLFVAPPVPPLHFPQTSKEMLGEEEQLNRGEIVLSPTKPVPFFPKDSFFEELECRTVDLKFNCPSPSTKKQSEDFWNFNNFHFSQSEEKRD